MVLKKTLCLLCTVLISGCAASGAMRGKRISQPEDAVRTFAEVYRRAKEAGYSTPEGVLRTGPDLGMDAPYIPVYSPPRIAKVWIPAHVADHDQSVMVAGHWTFLVVDEPRWTLSQNGADDIEVPFIVPGLPASRTPQKE